MQNEALKASSSSLVLLRRLLMVFDLCLAGMAALGLALYLGYALLHPEKF